jgi:hypothetical protein
MSNRLHYLVIGLGACSLFALGCNNAQTASVAPAPAATDEDLSVHEDGGNAEIAQALASLPAGDLESVRKQKNCPVSDEPLGSMGAPLKLAVEGREVFVCCEGCTSVLQGDPATFLAKLPPE